MEEANNSVYERECAQAPNAKNYEAEELLMLLKSPK
jgi:hypothetical protein